MSASPELARTPPEFSPRPLATTVRRPIEGHLKLALPSEEGEGEGAVEYADEEAAGCRTPTSEESKLPSVGAVCPPAPRKQPRTAVRCKRKLWTETELIAVGTEEMEQLFGRRVQRMKTPRKKRRCDDEKLIKH